MQSRRHDSCGGDTLFVSGVIGCVPHIDMPKKITDLLEIPNYSTFLIIRWRSIQDSLPYYEPRVILHLMSPVGLFVVERCKKVTKRALTFLAALTAPDTGPYVTLRVLFQSR